MLPKKIAVVACTTLRDEIELVMKDLSVEVPVFWVDSGLHNYKDRLRKAVQMQVDEAESSVEVLQAVLLAFGSCGNSLLGVGSSKVPLVLPKVDDCISLFLGGNGNRKKEEAGGVSYYFTRGYLEHERNIWKEYRRTVERYGKKQARSIFEIMLHNYHFVKVIDTGAFEVSKITETTAEIAKEFHLDHAVIPGTLRILAKAFRGDWDEEFVVRPPGQPFALHDLLWSGMNHKITS